MPLWTLFGLTQGKATTDWPRAPGKDGQDGDLGMPRFDRTLCDSGCSAYACHPEHGR